MHVSISTAATANRCLSPRPATAAFFVLRRASYCWGCALQLVSPGGRARNLDTSARIRYVDHDLASGLEPAIEDVDITGSGASAVTRARSVADAPPVALVSDRKQLATTHMRLTASQSSVRQRVFSRPKSPDAPEPPAREVSDYLHII